MILMVHVPAAQAGDGRVRRTCYSSVGGQEETVHLDLQFIVSVGCWKMFRTTVFWV